jgi:hypothetical protein
MLLGMIVALLGVLAVRAFDSGRPAHASSDQQPPEVLRARMIELVDVNGKTRSSLKVEPSGEVVFRLLDRTGTIRVKMGASEDGSGLLLLDGETEPGIQMLVKPANTSVTLAEKGHEKRILKP